MSQARTSKSLIILTLALAAGLGYTFYYYEAGPGLASRSINPVVATVNGMQVNKSELMPYLRDLVNSEQLAKWEKLEAIPEEIMQAGVNSLAIDKLIAQKATQESQVTKSEEFQALLEKTTNRLKRAAYLDDKSKNMVSEDAIKERYVELVASIAGKTEYRARHILLANEKEAKIITKALKEQPFEKLAKLFSLDEATGKTGGDLGYVLTGELDADFEKQASSMKVGATSKPFKTKLGWHIVKLEDRRESQPIAFEQAVPMIRRELQQKAMQEYLQTMLSEADVQVLIKSETLK